MEADRSQGEDISSESGVGSLLRASRKRVNEDLKYVAESLRIRYPYLEAIEDGRYSELPGPTYAVGFVRAYAEHLGLDSEEVVRRFKVEALENKGKSDLTFPEPIPETGIPGGAVAFIGVFIAALAYGGWYISTSDGNLYDSLISPIPERISELFPGDDGPDKAAVEQLESSKSEPETPAIVAVEDQPQPQSTTTLDATSASTLPADNASSVENSESVEPAESVVPAEAVVTAAAEPTLPTTIKPVAMTESASSELVAPAVAETTKVVAEVVEKKKPQAVAALVEATIEPTTPVQPVAIAEQVEEPVVAPDPKVQLNTPDTPATTSAVSLAENVAQIEVASTPAAAESEPVSEPQNSPTPSTYDIADSDLVQQETSPAPVLIIVPQNLALKVEEVALADPAPASKVEPVVVAAQSEPAGTQIAVEPSGIVIKAIADSWVQIVNSLDDTVVMERIMKSGDQYEVPNIGNLRLMAGNAGGIELLVNGVVVPSIGPSGAVRRNVQLDGARLKSGTATAN